MTLLTLIDVKTFKLNVVSEYYSHYLMYYSPHLV